MGSHNSRTQEAAVSPALLDIRPLSVFTGAEIHGVDLREPLTPALVAAIRGALDRWKVVFFRDQHIDHAQHLDFARHFGQPTSAHPSTTHCVNDVRHAFWIISHRISFPPNR